MYLSSMSLICSLGSAHEEIVRKLSEGDTSGMRQCDDYSEKSFMLGLIDEELPHEKYRCNAILAFCYEKIRDDVEKLQKRFGAERIGVVLGSSNGGIRENYENFRKYHSSNEKNFSIQELEINIPSDFLSRYAGLKGPAYTISTACTSGAKALISARGLIRSGICDAVITGGTDSLCTYAVNGFDSLEAMSAGRTKPFSRNRDGINMGEGGALFIMTKDAADGENIIFAGAGESSDAYHSTSPDPEGKGAYTAMKKALDDAGAEPADIDYINLHGTGTQLNDSMEGIAVHSLFGGNTPCSSTKPLTGHTLGASGAIEAAFCWLILSKSNSSNHLPGHVWDGFADPLIPEISLLPPNSTMKQLKRCLSNSFAFGGSNTSLLLSR